MKSYSVILSLVFLLPLFCPSCNKQTSSNSTKATADKAVIEGRVCNRDGSCVQGAKVSIKGTRFECITDTKGVYKIEYVPGNFYMNVSNNGYAPTERSYQITSPTLFPAEDIILPKLPTTDEIEKLLVSTLSNAVRKNSFGNYAFGEWFEIKKLEVTVVSTKIDTVVYKCVITTLARQYMNQGYYIMDFYEDVVENRSREQGFNSVDHFNARFTYDKASMIWNLSKFYR